MRKKGRRMRGLRPVRVVGTSSIPSAGQLQQRAMARLGTDRMMIIENGVVTFVNRNSRY